MCHAGLPKEYLMADQAARMKGVAFAAKKTEEPAQPERGRFAPVLVLVAGLMRKDALNV